MELGPLVNYTLQLFFKRYKHVTGHVRFIGDVSITRVSLIILKIKNNSPLELASTLVFNNI